MLMAGYKMRLATNANDANMVEWDGPDDPENPSELVRSEEMGEFHHVFNHHDIKVKKLPIRQH